MKIIPQLDGLRGIAVILVILSHWLNADNIVNHIPVGGVGVDIFFVLSGFLITRILLQMRDTETTRASKIKNFYARRSLRIFPAYYLLVLLLFLFHGYTETDIRNSIWYYLTYTSNFYFYDIGRWDGIVSHLWSLAVEEQFYIFWPFLMLFIPRRLLLPVILLFISLGLISQIILRKDEMMDVLTFCCFDAFGVGALLAWIITFRKNALKNWYLPMRIAGMAALIIFIAGVPESYWPYIPFRTLIAVITGWLIAYILISEGRNTGVLNSIMTNRALMFIGKISYGLYLYHLPVTMLTAVLIKPFLTPMLKTKVPLSPLYFVCNAVLLLGVSCFSYYVIERRFLNLKRIYTYGEKNIERKEEARAPVANA